MGSLRRQSLAIVIIILIASMIIGTAISRFVMENSLRNLETNDAERTLNQIKLIFSVQFDDIRKRTIYYAVWDTTYQFMHSADPNYINENYSEEILDNLNVDYAFLIREDGSSAMTLSKRSAHESKPAIGMSQTVDSHTSALLEMIKRKIKTPIASNAGSLLWLNEQAYFVGSSNVLTNEEQGPARGRLVFVSTLNPARMKLLQSMTNEQFTLMPNMPTSHKNQIDFINNRLIASSTIYDTNGRPIAELRIDNARPMEKQIILLQNFITVISVGMTLLALLLAYLLFDRVVLRKITVLVSNISAIRLDGKISNRLPLIDNREIDRISTEVNNLLDNLAGSHAQLQYDALHDHLTGLGNRKLFLQQLERACSDCRSSTQASFYVYLLDLDAFKDINDMYGHLAGDHVIKTIAGRLAHSASHIDLPIRIGGDEFALIARPKQAFDPEHFAAHLLGLITLPVLWENYSLTVCASIGIVAVDSAQKAADKPIELLRKADIAMYASKNTGKNAYRLFHEDIDKQLSERKRLEAELDIMIAQESSEIWLQPVVSQHDEKLYAVEVLSRWFHPDMGEIYPDVFIGIAEESKRIVKFDQSVIRRVCHLFSELQLLQPKIRISVNISATTLMEPFICDFIAEVLKTYALPEDALMLEITETALATRENSLIDTIQAIRKLGVTFLIDDFGTGYSSLSRLHTLPLDFVKIDRRFLQTLESEDNPICNAIIRLAHSLDMQVIAEGVETQLQHERLAALGCDYAQGFHYARPMPYKEFSDYVAKNNLS